MNVAAAKESVLTALIAANVVPADLFEKLKQEMSTSDLLVHAELGSKGQYDFEFNEVKNNNNIGNDILLSQNDAFIITAMNLLVGKVSSASPTDALRQNMHLAPYVNPNIFDGGDEVNINALYSGVFSLEVNKKTFIPAVSTRNFERVPQTQQGTFLGVNAASADETQGRDELPNEFWGFKGFEPILVNGGQSIQTSIRLAASAAMTESGETNYAVMRFRGFLINDGLNLLKR